MLRSALLLLELRGASAGQSVRSFPQARRQSMPMTRNMQRRKRRNPSAPLPHHCEEIRADAFLALLILQQASSFAALQFQFLLGIFSETHTARPSDLFFIRRKSHCAWR